MTPDVARETPMDKARNPTPLTGATIRSLRVDSGRSTALLSPTSHVPVPKIDLNAVKPARLYSSHSHRMFNTYRLEDDPGV